MAQVRSIGILANPASSKDIRRIISQATMVPNHAKVNMLRRVLLGLAATDIDQVWYMPDDAGLMRAALDRLDIPFTASAVDMPISKTAQDTTTVVQHFEERGAACCITLGGDGTARAAVKGSRSLPLLALSTGTNNAFPYMVEPTLAGIAAGVVAQGYEHAVKLQPLLELYCNDVYRDLALVDIAAVKGSLGGRAVWEIERVQSVVTTVLTPHTVGLSAIGGFLGLDTPPMTIAVAVDIGGDTQNLIAPIAPGLVTTVPIAQYTWLHDAATYTLPESTILAFDGEREIHARKGETWTVQAVEQGVAVVDVQSALQAYTEVTRV